MPRSYRDIKKPENRILYLNLLDKGTIFSEDKIKLDQLQKFLHTGDSADYAPKIKSYADLVALYVNLKEKDFSWKTVNDFRMLSRKLGPSFKIEGKRKNMEK